MIQRTWFRTTLLSVAVVFSCGLSACGGETKLACDEQQRYQQAVDNRKVQSPEDLDQLESLREMPLPQANPAQERPPGSPCLDLPPRVGPTN